VTKTEIWKIISDYPPQHETRRPILAGKRAFSNQH
jgi:hypothetical protein